MRQRNFGFNLSCKIMKRDFIETGGDCGSKLVTLELLAHEEEDVL